MSRPLAYIILVMSLLILGLNAQGQRTSRTDLKKEREKLEDRIRLSSQLLAETSYQRDKSLVELSLLNEQIKAREALIRRLNIEIDDLGNEITDLDAIICAMEEDIEDVKEQYALTAQTTYKTLESDNWLLAIFSAESFAEAYYRTQYLQQFTTYRRTQLRRLRKTKAFLLQKTAELQGAIQARELLIQEKQDELNRLKNTKATQNSLFFTLKEKENKYRVRLTQQRKALKSIIKRIDRNYGVKATGKNNATGKSFKQQRGKLGWPVSASNSIVVGKYGVTKDPFGNRITNDGIYIRTPKGQKVQAVFQGKVTGVQKVPLSGYVVIVEHGIYRTVYDNLDKVSVKKGAAITMGQEIGTVRTDPRTNETILNFMIYRIPNVFENPLRWVRN